MTAKVRSDEAFDPQAPLIASDGLEYACFADRLLDRPVPNWRNSKIKLLRSQAIPEKEIRRYYEAFDAEAHTGPVRRDAKKCRSDRELSRNWDLKCHSAAHAATGID